MTFDRLRARSWDACTNEFSVEQQVRAQVYVFAIQTQLVPDQYEVLDLAHWEFWVVAGHVVRDHAGKTVGIGWVRQHATGPISYPDLADHIGSIATA